MQTDQHSEIWVYSKTPFENSYQNVIKFNSQDEIDSFFNENNPLIEEIYHDDKHTQIRKNGHILIEGRVDKYEKANYMRFKNYGRMFYAFILDCAYTNENTTEIVFEIDVWMTYHLELFNDTFSGYVEQANVKNFNEDGSRNIVPFQQGFNSGNKQVVEIEPLNLEIDWLIFVLKPTAKIADVDTMYGKYGFPSTFKSFRYFIVPINLSRSTTYSFKYDNYTYKSTTISALVEQLTNIFDEESEDGTNTVNQCMNLYVTKHCGLDYEFDGTTVDIKSSGLTVHKLGVFYTESPANTGNITTSYGGSVPWDTDIIYNWGGSSTQKVFPSDLVGQLIYLCRIYKIKPSFLLAAIFHESLWGISGVAVSNNNWSGVSSTSYFDGERTRSSGIIVTCGTARPEGLYYYAYKSVGDWLTDYLHILRPIPWGNGGMYNISEQTNFDDAIKGLFIVGGASGNYAADPWNVYLAACRSHYNNIIRDNGQALIDQLDAMVYNNGEWLTNDPAEMNVGFAAMEDALGKSIGNGQCYALASLYVGTLGGPKMGCQVPGFDRDEPILPGGDGMCAGMIGVNHDFAKYGWEVVFSPSFSDLRIGDVIVWAGYTRHFSPGLPYGHVDIIRGLKAETDSNPILTYTQNWGNDATTFKRELPWYEAECACTIHPPAEAIGGTITGSLPSLQGTGSSTTSSDGYPIIEVVNLGKTEKKEIETINIKYELIKYISSFLNIAPEYVESQLLTSEFCEVKLYDGFGNAHYFLPELVPTPVSEDQKEEAELHNIISVYGAVGDSNHVHYALNAYNENDLLFDKTGHELFAFNYGLSDSFTKSMTILSDQSDTFFQANKNQYDAQQANFIENKEMQQKNFELSYKQVALTNEHATYNSDYAVQSAKIGLVTSGLNALSGIIGNTAKGVIKGGVGGGITSFTSSALSGGADIYNAYNSYQNTEKQAEFTQEENSMRSESNALSNMQAKLALNQSIRAYNASVKDLDNQPVSIQQLGTDMSFQIGNRFNDVYLSISIAQPWNIEQAQQYFKAFGVLQNKYYQDIREIFNNRIVWNYIKCGDIDITKVSINKAHLNALKSIFITGVRVWNNGNYLNDGYLDLTLTNTDNNL